MAQLFLSEDKKHFSIRLDDGNTRAFNFKIYKVVDDNDPMSDVLELGENTNLKQQVDNFAGEGFFDNNIKGIL